MEMSQNEIAAIKEKYVPGMRIRCLYMEDERGVPGGTCGTVVFVDDIGTMALVWGFVLVLMHLRSHSYFMNSI